MDFVPFEIAKQLKEKGVPQGPENFFWRSYDDWTNHAEYYHFDERRSTLYQTNNCKWKMWYEPTINRNELYIAPTISQVLKWLREEYSIHISTNPYPCEDGLMWLYEIRKLNKYIVFVIANKTGFVEEYQAFIAGIEYVIDKYVK